MSSKRKPPGLKSVAKVKEQASQFVGSKKINKLVKEALLKELNSNLLTVQPQKIHRHAGKAHEEAGGQHLSENPYRSQMTTKKPASATNDAKPLVERHGQVSSMVPSRIPRPSKPIEQPAVKKQREIQPAARTKGYDWHKQGRVHELKLRFLARKYSGIWMRKVFGRVPPQIARKFYERKLMRNAINILEDAWWKTRKGWKLNIRAEYHNRYRLWKNSFKAWRLYTHNEKEQKIKHLHAVKFDENVLLNRYFGVLQRYYVYRNEKKKEKLKADKFHAFKTQRWIIRRWKTALRRREKNRSLEVRALSLWAFNLKSKMFFKWKFRKIAADDENLKMAVAIKHNHISMMRQCFAAFNSYIVYRRKKRYVKDFSTGIYNDNLKRRTIRLWYSQLQHRLEVLELHDHIKLMSRKFILRSYFIRWTSYINFAQEYQNKLSLSSAHYELKLKARCFKALCFVATQRNAKNSRMDMAIGFRKRMLISKAWTLWLLRCEHTEELKLYPLTKIGRSFHRKNSLKTYFTNWCKYVNWRRSRKQLYAIADRHFEKRSLPKFFALLHKYKEIRKGKIERKLIADDFNRELMYAKCFYTWLKNSRLNQELRMLEMMAILHHEETSKRTTLCKWRLATKLHLQEKRAEILADSYNELAQKKKYFNLLKCHAMNEKERRMQTMTAISHDRKAKLVTTFVSWKKYTISRRMKRRKLNLAVSHYRKVLLSKAMISAKVYMKESRKIQEDVCRRVDFHNKLLLSWVVRQWHENACDAVEERQKFEKAENHSNLRILTTVLEAWRNLTAMKLYKQSQQNIRLDEIRSILDRGKLKRAFLAMVQFKELQKRKNNFKKTAMRFYACNITAKCFTAWKKYRQLAFRKLLLQRQSELFYVKIKQFEFFQRWKMQHQMAIHQRNRQNVVLWLWSRNVQRKMFYSWREFVTINKSKKFQRMKALELRRELLLENCLQKWFQHSTDMIAFRAKIAQTRQIQGAVKLQERVRKYALHWYRKSKRAKSKDKIVNESNNYKTLGTDINTGIAALVSRTTAMKKIPIITIEPRPLPRKPDYLRASFDLNELVGTSANLNGNDLQMIKDESNPRENVPKPVEQMQKHPAEGESVGNCLEIGFLSEDGQQNVQPSKLNHQTAKRISKKQDVILLPPSSFKLTADAKVAKAKKRGEAGNEASEMVRHLSRETEEKGMNEITQTSMSERGDEDGEEESGEFIDDYQSSKNNEIINEISKIKNVLENYKKQQKYLNELKKRSLHISSWLSTEMQNSSGNDLENDNDIQQAMELQTQMKAEMTSISKELSLKKPTVTKLAKDIQSLIESLKIQ